MNNFLIIVALFTCILIKAQNPQPVNYKTMEQYENGFTSDSISDWIKSEKKLFALLTKIEKSTSDPHKQADQIFNKVSELFNVPKYPDDIESGNEDGPLYETSVYEQTALLKYLEPEPDKLPEHVLGAIYFIVHGTEVDPDFIFEKYEAEGSDRTSISGFGYKNEGVTVELVIVTKDQSWVTLGCKYFTALR